MKENQPQKSDRTDTDMYSREWPGHDTLGTTTNGASCLMSVARKYVGTAQMLLGTPREQQNDVCRPT